MPQMMPINWLMIFLMCLLCLLILMILLNSLILFMKMKIMKNMFLNKKWMWLW
nr:TPA_asm: ATP8 [Bombus laesus]